MNNAKARSNKWATHNTEPTMTDQSGADETDINVIVKKYGVFGTVPGSNNPPIFGDFADIPTTLAESIELIRSIPELHAGLPGEAGKLTLNELLQLNDEQLKAKLTPPVPPPPPKDEPK